MTKGLILARVSGDIQEREGTIETQVEVVTEFFAKRGIPIVGCYPDEDCKNTVPFEERPHARNLLPYLRQQRKEGDTDLYEIGVYTADRASRSQVVFWPFWGELKKLGAKFVSATEEFDDDTPQGQKVLADLITEGGYEVARLRQKFGDGKRILLAATYTLDGEQFGIWPGGIVPYGYLGCDVVRDKGKRRGKGIRPDEEPLPGLEISAAGVILLMFTWRAEECLSDGKICDRLGAMGVPTQSFLPMALGRRDGKALGWPNVWKNGVVSRILRNPIYYGALYYGKSSHRNADRLTGTERRVPALVSDELWAKAQEQTARNKAMSKRNAIRQYLLRGFMRCAHCGGSIHGMAYGGAHGKREDRWYYVCSSRVGVKGDRDRMGLPPCPSGFLRETVEELVLQAVMDLIRRPDATLTRIRAQMEGPDASHVEIRREIDAKQDELATYDKAKARANERYDLGLTDLAGLHEALARHEQRGRVLKEEIAELERTYRRAADVESHVGAMQNFLQQFRAAPEELVSWSWERKRELLEICLQKILVTWEDGVPMLDIRLWVTGEADLVVTRSWERRCHNLSIGLEGIGSPRRRVTGGTEAVPARRSWNRSPS